MYAKCGSMLDARLVFDSLPDTDIVCWNALISGYADNGEASLALENFRLMYHTTALKPSPRTFVAALKACTVMAERQEHKSDAFTKGAAIHRAFRDAGIEPDVYIMNTLVNMYSKLGCLEQARILFEGMTHKDVVTWNSIIQGYAENGEEVVALAHFSSMSQPDSRTFVLALKACSGLAGKGTCETVGGMTVLEQGYVIHSQAVANACDSHPFVSSALINMYSHCGSLLDARGTFDRMKHHDVVSWNSLMAGYVDNGEEHLALKLFRCMRSRCFSPNDLTFVSVLNACSSLAAAEEGQVVDGRVVKLESLKTGREIHREVGMEVGNGCVRRALVSMYGKCGSLVESRRVLDKICLKEEPSSWTALMLAYAENGEGDLALDIFTAMQRENVTMDDRALVAAAKACTSLGVREEGVEVREKVVKLASLAKGMAVHSVARGRASSESSIFVGNSLLDMYSKCRSLLDARKVFDTMQYHTVVSWNSLMLGYVENDAAEVALDLFHSLFSSFRPDALTFVAVLKACSALAAQEDVVDKLVKLESLERCMSVHAKLSRSTSMRVDVMCGNTLIDVYSKCGSLYDARLVFDTMESHSLVSWNALMQGCVENGKAEMALKLFSGLLRHSLSPDCHSFTQALKASGAVASLGLCRAIHGEVCRHGSEVDRVVVASLLDVYGKCGNVCSAQLVFDSVPCHDSVCWTAVIAGYSLQGEGERVVKLFHEMHEEGFEADEVTYVCVLAMCSHAGLVERCSEYFQRVRKDGRLRVGLEHLTCLVDALGRMNRLDAAVEAVESMGVKPSSATWRALLAACCKWRNASVGKVAFDKLIGLDEHDISAYVLMRNMLSYPEKQNLQWLLNSC